VRCDQVPQPVVIPGSAVDGPLGALLLRCLALDPADRPHDAGAFLDALDAALAGRVLPPLPRRPAAVAVPRDKSPANAPAPLLVPCAECGQLVSRQASACPRCGAPLKRRRKRGGMIAAFVVGSLLAGGGVFALERQGMLHVPSAAPAADSASSSATAVVPLLDTVRVVETRKPVIVHVAAARWKTGSVESDGGCSRLFDSCLRVRCTVSNTGDADGETEVTARVYGRETYRRVRSVRLEAGGRQVMTFDFPEVRNGEDIERVTCRPASAGGPPPARKSRPAPRDTLRL